MITTEVWNIITREWITPDTDCESCSGTGAEVHVGTYSHISHELTCGQCSGSDEYAEQLANL